MSYLNGKGHGKNRDHNHKRAERKIIDKPKYRHTKSTQRDH